MRASWVVVAIGCAPAPRPAPARPPAPLPVSAAQPAPPPRPVRSVAATPPAVGPDQRVGAAFDGAAVLETIGRSDLAIKRCYRIALKKDPNAGAPLAFQLTIGPDGKVTAASAATLTAPLEKCIVGVIKGMTFPAPGTTVDIAYPMVEASPHATIRAVVKRHLPEIAACLQGKLDERLVVDFTIGLDGTVTTAIGNDCVAGVFRRMTFPRQTTVVRVQYPVHILVAGQ